MSPGCIFSGLYTIVWLFVGRQRVRIGADEQRLELLGQPFFCSGEALFQSCQRQGGHAQEIEVRQHLRFNGSIAFFELPL